MKGDRNRPCSVYLVTNTVNGKRYVGVTTAKLARRLYEHVYDANRHKNKCIFHRAIRKYGQDAFKIDLLRICGDVNEALREEVRLIEETQPEYNSTKGGEASVGFKHSAENSERLRRLHRGNTYRLGKSHSPETRQRLREMAMRDIERWKVFARLGPESQQRKVICLDDGQTFVSAKLAAAAYKVSRSALVELCRGQRFRKTVGGRRFAYVEGARP